MTGRERIQAAFHCAATDRVPIFEQSIATQVASEVVGRRINVGGGGFRRDGLEAALAGPEAQARFNEQLVHDLVDLFRAVPLDMFRPPWRMTARPDRKLGENTYLFGHPSGEFEIVRYDPSSDQLHTIDSDVRRGGVAVLEAKLERAFAEEQPEPTPDPYRCDLLDRFRAELGEDVALGASCGMLMVPMQAEYLQLMLLRPDLIERMLEGQMRQGLADIEEAARHRVDVIVGGGDLATNHGPVYSPALFKGLLLPRLKRIVARCNELGLYYMWRTDGVIWPIAESLFVEAGCHAYGEIDAQAGMDLGEIKARYPQLVVWGGLDCGKVLSGWSVEEVKAETRRVIDQCRPYGGHILGSSNSIHAGVAARNFLAMIEAAVEYG